jgi:ketosteroid isomerase-like protein
MKNDEVLKSYLDAFFKGDLEGATSFLADDFKVIESEGMPYSGEWIGKAGFSKLIETVYGCWSDMKVELTEIIGGPNSDSFAVLMNMEGKSSRNGRPFSTSLCEIWSVRDSKLTLVKPYYWDTKLMSELAAG